jgi:hypothetical protein
VSRIAGVLDAQPARGQVADDRRNERRQQRFVFDAPEHDELEAEQRARNGCPEHGTEATSDTRCKQLTARLSLEP